MSRSTVLMALLSISASGCATGPIVLDARALYGGFDARRVLLNEAGGKLVLGARAAKLGTRGMGIVVTDPIAVAPTDGVLELPAVLRGVEIAVEADVPQGATVTAAVPC